MQINTPELLALEQLLPNPDNPKKPIGARYLRGLRASLERYGFCGVLEVGENLDGTCTVLDGNTRLEELDKAGVRLVPVQKVPACREGAPGWQEERRAFVLAHDRNRKVFDEDAVAAQLKDLSARGMEVATLAALTATENLRSLIASGEKAKAEVKAALQQASAQASLTLYGPAEDVDAIKQLLKRIKSRLGPVFKLRSTLEQTDTMLRMDDESFLLCFAGAFSRWLAAKEGAS